MKLRELVGYLPKNFTGDSKQDCQTLVAALANIMRRADDIPALVKFPSVAVDDPDSNTLDDYEEGNWTPTDTSGAGLTFTTPTGHYTKIGNMVHAWGNVTYPVTANASAARIGGLPFTVANTEASRGGGLVTYSDETTLAYIIVAKNATDMGLAASSGATVSNATMSGNVIYFMVVYPVA